MEIVLKLRILFSKKFLELLEHFFFLVFQNHEIILLASFVCSCEYKKKLSKYTQ